MGNPLIADTEPTSHLQGSSLATDAFHLGKELVTDNSGWTTVVDGSLGLLDILSSVENPFGSLIANGVGWLMEHIPGLDTVWRKLMGDAAGIEQIAKTWENIAKALGEAESRYNTASREIEQWSGPASDSYRQVAQAWSSSLGGADAEAQGLAIVVQLIGGLVASLKDLVYTIIANFIEFTVIPWILGAIATSWCTFGGSIAAAITAIEIQAEIAGGQITIKITKTTEEVTIVTERTIKVVSKVEKMAKTLDELHTEIHKATVFARYGKDFAYGTGHGEIENQRGRTVEHDDEANGSDGGEG